MIHRCDVFKKLRLLYFKHGCSYLLFYPWCLGHYWAHNRHPMNVQNKCMNTMVLKAWTCLQNQLERSFKDQEMEVAIFSIIHLEAMLNKIKFTLWTFLMLRSSSFFKHPSSLSSFILGGTHRGVFWHQLLTQVRDCLKERIPSSLLLIFSRAYIMRTNEIQSYFWYIFWVRFSMWFSLPDIWTFRLVEIGAKIFHKNFANLNDYFSFFNIYYL